jgi:hypothetical protein
MIVSEDGATYEIKSKDNVTKAKSVSGFSHNDETLAKCTNTGNGFIFKFPAWSSVYQDNYVCLDYAEADYIRNILNYLATKDDSL